MDRFRIIPSHSRGDEICGGASTWAAAIEVAQRALIDVGEREKCRQWRHGETIAIRIEEDAAEFGNRGRSRHGAGPAQRTISLIDAAAE